jgi:exopolyphosphatase/guanosine-5'-triphosphate,3'-diphosphate pyrophosphatase
METVLNDRSLPLTTWERRTVGSVVRYHNSLPSEDHYNISSMDRRTKRTVLVLSSVLRVADALDASHGSKVGGVDVKIGPRSVALECSVSGSHDEESDGLSRKADLFERTFKRNLRVDWTSGHPC